MNYSNEEIFGWGRTKPVKVKVVTPKNLEEIKDILDESDKESILARGLGRSYGDSAQLKNGTILKLSKFKNLSLNKKRSEITAGAGISFETILKFIVPMGFFLPVVPGTKFITLGGAIASDVHGKNHHKDGSFGNFVKKILILNSSCEILEIGPNHPYSEEKKEMFWATVGGLGLTGIILEATFSLKKISTSYMNVNTVSCNDIDSLMRKMVELDNQYEYSVAWIDTLNKNIRGILTCANHANSSDIQDIKKIINKLSYESNYLLKINSFLRMNLVNKFTIKLFNEIWFRKVLKKKNNEIQTINKFFHPLDSIQNWNKLYGKNGFYQYQFVVPDKSVVLIKEFIQELNRKKIPSFLGVLKRFGAANKGMLSFPMRGWTLTLDFPSATFGLLPLLDKYDDLIRKAGGKIYLAKDARLSSKAFRKSYNELTKWNSIRDKMDTNHLLQSDISNRLKIIKK